MFKGKSEGSIISRDEAEKMLESWADILELDTKRELYSNVLDELTGVVEKGRLTFDEESEIFKYRLLKPVDGKELIEIHETTLKEKKALQRYKENESMEAAIMMVTKHTNLTFKQVEMLKSRDLNKINAVIIGFLTQTAMS